MIMALLVLAPLVWSMGNENTALVKSYAAGVFAVVVLLSTSLRGLWMNFRHATPAHALLILAVVSAGCSSSPSFAWPPVLLALTLWLLAAAAVAQPPAFWRRALILAAALPILMGVVQIAGLDPTPWGNIVHEHFHDRICSSLGNPNFFAAFLVGVLPFLVWGSAGSGSGAGRFCCAGLTGLAFITLLFTGSKGGLLGLLAAGVTLGLVMRPGRLISSSTRTGHGMHKMVAPACLALIGTLMLLAALPAQVRSRLFFQAAEESGPAGAGSISRNESVRFRMLTWGQTLRMVRDAPLTGHGVGRYQVVYPRYRLPEIIHMFGQHSYMTDHPENLTLEIGAELGLIGLGLWLWLLTFTARSLARKLRSATAQNRWHAAASASALTGIFITNSVGVDIHYGATGVLAACLLGAALSPVSVRSPRPVSVRPRTAFHPARVGPALLLAMLWTRLYASDAALARALAFSEQQAWSPALRYYRLSSRFNPANIMSRYFGGSALLDRGRADDLKEARRLFDTVSREAPDYVLLNYKYWLLYNMAGQTQKAQDALQRQIELDPLAAVFYLDRGRLALNEQRWEDAHRDFKTAIRVEPDNPGGYQYLGNLMVLGGRFTEALDLYMRGLARNPGSTELHYNAAVAAWKLHDPAKARMHAEAVLRNAPHHAQAKLILTKIP